MVVDKYDIDFTSTTAKLPRKDMVIHAAYSSMAFNISWIIFGYYLVYFYTDVVGLSATVAGLITLCARLFDCVTDLLLGYFMDNKCLRWGRYRSWSIIGLPIITVLFIAVFTNLGAGASMTTKILWAAVSYGLFGAVGATLTFLPGVAQLNNMTKNPGERALTASIKGVLNCIASVTGATFFISMADSFGADGGNTSQGFFWAAVVIAALVAVCIILNIAITKKYELNRDGSIREHLRPVPGKHVSIFAQFKELFTNGPAVILMSGQLLYQTMIAVRNGMLIYVFSYFWGLDGFYSTAVLCNSLAMVVGALLLKPAIKLLRDSNRAYKVSMILDAACSIALFVFIKAMGAEASAASIHYGVLFVLFLLNGVFLGLHNSFANVLLPATIDYGEWKHGRSQAGMVSSIYGLAITLGSAVGGFVLGILLDASGYVANTVQTDSTLNKMLLLTFIVPAVLALAQFVVQSFWKITDKKQEQMLHEINARRAAEHE